jgi:zinc transport system permease protein
MVDILLYPIIAASGVALITSIVGPFMLWQRMAYFGDSLVHSALLGVALSLVLQLDITIGVILISALFALFLTSLEKTKLYSSDTILGIIAHSALAIGLVAVSLVKGDNDIELEHLLLGDVMAVSKHDIMIIYVGLLIVALFVVCNWRKLLMVAMDRDLAMIAGIKPNLMKFKFMLLVAIIVAVSIKITGILLITAMLIIPAAISRLFTSSPLSMVLLAMIIALLSVFPGVFLTHNLNLPSGAAIVIVLTGFFILSLTISLFLRRR